MKPLARRLKSIYHRYYLENNRFVNAFGGFVYFMFMFQFYWQTEFLWGVLNPIFCKAIPIVINLAF